MESHTISLIIAVYNTSEYLAECLNSVIAQTYKNLEIICVNDGSTDNSADILQKYRLLDQRIRIIEHEKNIGLLEAWRTGAEYASGDYIQFVDSDDTVDPELCESAIKIILEQNVDFIQFSARRINVEKQNAESEYITAGVNLAGKNILEHFFISRKEPTANWMKLYKTELVKKAFSEIPKQNTFIPGEDILLAFFIDYFASSYVSMKTDPKYNYHFGRGISSGMNMPLTKFAKYCKMNVYPAVTADFLSREQADPLAFAAMQHMSLRFLTDCWKYYGMVEKSEKKEALRLFLNSWKNDPVFPEFLITKMDDERSESEKRHKSEIDKMIKDQNELYKLIKYQKEQYELIKDQNEQYKAMVNQLSQQTEDLQLTVSKLKMSLEEKERSLLQ